MAVYEGAVLFFDGECNLCNRAVQFVLRHDKAGKIKFAQLQSAAGAKARDIIKAALGKAPDALIFYRKGKYYVASNAALEVATLLDGGWKWLSALKLFPLKLRDRVYSLVAKRRYKWFGKRDACMIPTPELQERFLT